MKPQYVPCAREYSGNNILGTHHQLSPKAWETYWWHHNQVLGIIAEAICAAISFIRRQNKQQSALFLLSKLERSSNSSLAAEGQPAVMAQIPRHHSRDYTQTWHGPSVRIVEASGPAGLTVPREDQLEEAFKRKRAKYKELIEICQNRVLRAHCLAIHSMGPPSCSREPSGTCCCCWKALKVLKLLWSKRNNLLDSTSSQDTTWGLITQVRVYDVENPETLIKSLMFHSKVC